MNHSESFSHDSEINYKTGYQQLPKPQKSFIMTNWLVVFMFVLSGLYLVISQAYELSHEEFLLSSLAQTSTTYGSAEIGVTIFSSLAIIGTRLLTLSSVISFIDRCQH